MGETRGMNVPSLDDRCVEVAAYLTDDTFGYTHWRAAQFSPPKRDKWGVLVLFATEEERATFLHWWNSRNTVAAPPSRGTAERGTDQ